MKRIERRARIEAPPEALFAYLSDLDNLPEWQTGIVSAEITSGDELGVGTTARVVRDLMGQRIEAPMTVTAYEPPSRLAIRSEVSGVKATAELDMTPADGGATDASIARIQGRFAGTA